MSRQVRPGLLPLQPLTALLAKQLSYGRIICRVVANIDMLLAHQVDVTGHGIEAQLLVLH